MPVLFNTFKLQDGFIHNWLTAGPVAETAGRPGNLQEWVKSKYSNRPQIEGRPVEQGPLTEGLYRVEGRQGAWEYYRCREDHLVDLSVEYSTPQYVRAWAFSGLESAAGGRAGFRLLALCAADVWVNGEHACRLEEPGEAAFDVELNEGHNEVLVRMEGLAAPALVLAMSLRVEADGANASMPSLIPSLERRNALEAVNEKVYLDRDVYGFDQKIFICWPPRDEDTLAYQDVRLQAAAGSIYANAEDVGKPDSRTQLGNSAALSEGPYHAILMPRAWEFYESQIRITRQLDCYVLGRNRFSSAPYGTLAERRAEALAHAQSCQGNLFAEVARMASGKWNALEPMVILQALEALEQQAAGCEVLLLGLVGMLHRFGHRKEFPRPLMKTVRERILQLACWMAAPGFSHEGGGLLYAASQLIAGQLYPQAVFAGGQTGVQLRQQGEQHALAWMRARGRGGLEDWDSESVLAEALMGLSYLVDAAKNEEVWGLASVLMDKFFFSIAVNSYKGVFGPSQGRTRASALKSGQLQALSGITRLMWGTGGWNQQIAPLVSLACMRKYDLPPIFAEIALGAEEEMLDREQQAIGERVVNKITYRTPDGMLSSAQDYTPGRPGGREHIWQATFGPQCLVFTNHPGCSTEKDAHAPNFWLGNAVLPRVAQWKDTLVALYRLPEDDRMGFTHAYFPTYEFDEYVIRDGTAFARKGEGYLALTATHGLELLESGRTAWRELRAWGSGAWVCRLGRAALDGDFAAFQESVLAKPVSAEGLQLTLETLRGEQVSFGWEGPLLVNGKAQALNGYPHYENPYTTATLPCEEMEIHTGEYILKLDFSDQA